MSQTTKHKPCWRAGRLMLTTLIALVAMAVAAGTAQAWDHPSDAAFSITKQTDAADNQTIFTFKVECAPQPNDSCTPDSGETQPPDTFTLVGGQTIDFPHVHKGFYTVSELTPTGWQLADIQCSPQDPDPDDAYVIDLTAGSVVIELSNGENKQCTFVNHKQPTPPVVTPPEETVSGAETPGIGVAPAVELRPGTARLAAPARCVSRRYTISVSGAPVRSVSWFVNGRFIKRTWATNRRQRIFRTTFLPGAHIQRVRAHVTFRANSTIHTRTLTATIRRCTAAVIRPQFTG